MEYIYLLDDSEKNDMTETPISSVTITIFCFVNWLDYT